MDFVSHLSKHERIKDVNTLVRELPTVKFEEVDGFKNIAFHPIGIDGYQTYRNPLEQRDFDDLLIITPFVDVTTLKKMHKICPNKKVLISREEELKKIPAEVFHGYDPYFLARRVVDGEAFEDLDETDLEPQKQQLHAKLFIGERRGRYFWFLGSANCTDPAFTRNTEFMVELEGANDRTGPKQIRNILICPDDDTAVFEPYEPEETEEDGDFEGIRHLIRKLEFELINTVFAGKVERRQNTQNYDLTLNVDLRKKQWEEHITVKISPLNFDKKHQTLLPDHRNSLVFENLSEVELSRFVAISIYYKSEMVTSFLIKMRIDLPESRKDKILKSLITSRENFFKYLSFLLSDNPYIDTKVHDKDGSNGNDPEKEMQRNPFSDLPIFEHLLITASGNPNKLKSIDRLVQRLTDENHDNPGNIIPDDFYAFWDVFKKVAGIK